ncbi:D-aminoacylase [Tissierella sp. Yu-01]|uniref:N-acyl-D-amino-acid deacylase family protein n=1 Tax=Tissierella sp. Yu-01 TaxID=3035694 RepID=UPI00240D4DBC|nr:D-aminoacylase [Tissierella sp. Yu-01]WFA10084.1 D-aminoacylase [Tissierella sp. Yu-01]
MYDFVLKDGLIVDGTRRPPYKASLCIKDGKIAAIVDEYDEMGKDVIDCNEMIISPGFIDLHTHSDAVPLNSVNAVSMLHQGVTTQIAGNCGISIFPSNLMRREEIRSFFARTIDIVPENESIIINNMEDYFHNANQNYLSINTGMLIGHGTLRACVMGFEDRKPTTEEMGQMKKLLEKELKSGVFGMSLGLIYPPSSYGDIEEFTELAKVIKENDGILTVHMRNEGDGIFDSVNEMIQVAEESGVHLHISHLKLMGKPQWGKSDELLDYIELARQRGCTITCDQYPYEATATGLAALIPGWALNGGNAKMLQRLKEMEDRLINDIYNIMEKRGGPSRVVVSTTHGRYPELEGKNIEEISEILGLSTVDSVIELLLKCNGEVSAIYFSLHEDDILNIMKSIDITTGSDGEDFSYDVSYNPHPRYFGTFPRYLQMVRENNLISLEDTVYKITGLPAKILNLPDRGILEVGNIADITVFDYKEVQDMATFKKSPVKPKGIKHVFVRGLPALYNEEQTINREGRILLKSM